MFFGGEVGLAHVTLLWAGRGVCVTWSRFALPTARPADMGAIVWVFTGGTDVGRGGTVSTDPPLANKAWYVREFVLGWVWVKGGKADAAVTPVTFFGHQDRFTP